MDLETFKDHDWAFVEVVFRADWPVSDEGKQSVYSVELTPRLHFW